MTPEILTMLGMTATILISVWTMNRSLRADLKADIRQVEVRLGNEIKDLRSEIEDLRREIKALNEKFNGKIEALRIDVSNLSESMATLEGAMSALRDVIAGRALA